MIHQNAVCRVLYCGYAVVETLCGNHTLDEGCVYSCHVEETVTGSAGRRHLHQPTTTNHQRPPTLRPFENICSDISTTSRPRGACLTHKKQLRDTGRLRGTGGQPAADMASGGTHNSSRLWSLLQIVGSKMAAHTLESNHEF